MELLLKQEYLRFYVATRCRLNITATQCYQELSAAYGDAAPSRATIFQWHARFRGDEQGGQSSSMEDKPRSGHPKAAHTREVIDEVAEMVEEDQKCTVHDLAVWCNQSNTTIYRILTKDLHQRSVSSAWVPHILSAEHKVLRVNCAKHIRRVCYREGRASFINKLVVQDETWIYLQGQAPKASNWCWLQEGEDRHQVVRRQISDKKVMLLFAFSPSGRFSVQVVPAGQTVDSDIIIAFIQHTGDLWRKLRQNPIKLQDVLWQWDNARPHSSRAVSDYLQQCNINTLFQSPYSPDFNMCDRFVFS